MVEHCSADKLMQQSRLSQQHTPRLAKRFGESVPMAPWLTIRTKIKSWKRARRKPLNALNVSACHAEELSLVLEVEPEGRTSCARLRLSLGGALLDEDKTESKLKPP